MAPDWLAVAIAAVMLVILAFALSGASVDQYLGRRAILEAERLRAHVAELEATKRELQQMANSLSKASRSPPPAANRSPSSRRP
ncbi:MAG: hypothetical protein U1E87_04175 [Alphaproteobacteria bacterium]